MPNSTTDSPRQKILDSAAHLFARKGFAATGMREIARNASVNLAMINYYFGSKIDILRILLDEFFTGFITEAERNLTSSGTIPSKLTRYIHGTIHYFSQNVDRHRVAIIEFPFDVPEIVDLKTSYVRRLIALFQTHVIPSNHPDDANTLADAFPITIIGPALGAMMSSFFLMSPIISRLRPMDVTPAFISWYADIISTLFLHGVTGLLARSGIVLPASPQGESS